MARFEDPSPEQLEKPPRLYGSPVSPPGVQVEVVEDLGQVALLVSSPDRDAVAPQALIPAVPESGPVRRRARCYRL